MIVEVELSNGSIHHIEVLETISAKTLTRDLGYRAFGFKAPYPFHQTVDAETINLQHVVVARCRPDLKGDTHEST